VAQELQLVAFQLGEESYGVDIAQVKEASRGIHYALEAEKIHAEMYRKAKEAALQGKDMELGTVYICPVCGYTVEGEAPQFCPVCGASKEKFKGF